ncbi:MAG: dTMP kinase [Bacteroidota bacterium]
MRKGKFIVFEGIDGSGKTTQIKRLTQQFEAMNWAYHDTKEPTDRPVGKLIRRVLNRELKLGEKTMAALFLADRLDHIQHEEDGMLAKVAQGIHVISDRYYLSSYAYHSTHVPLDWVIAANRECAKLLRPDLVIFLDITPEKSLARIKKSRASLDLYETEEQLKKVRKNYFIAMERVEAEEHIVVIDATQKETVIAATIWEAVAGLSPALRDTASL